MVLKKNKEILLHLVSARKIRKYNLVLHFIYWILCTKTNSVESKQIQAHKAEENFNLLTFTIPQFWMYWLVALTRSTEISINLIEKCFESPKAHYVQVYMPMHQLIWDYNVECTFPAIGNFPVVHTSLWKLIWVSKWIGHKHRINYSRRRRSTWSSMQH